MIRFPFRAVLALVLALPGSILPNTVMAAPQFVPPNGLPLDTPLGPERMTDGSAVVTFRTILHDLARNASGLTDLAGQSVTQNTLDSALVPYLKTAEAASAYATSQALAAAVQAEADRASIVEQSHADAIAALQSGSVTKDRLMTALAPYLTQEQAQSTYLPRSGGTVTGGLRITGTTELADVMIRGLSLFSAAGASDANGLQVSGQGSVIGWNTASRGRGATELVNVNPGTYGGFRFYDAGTGTKLTTNTTPLLDLSPAGGAVFSGLAGNDTAYVCVRASGQLFRSDTACR